MTPYQDGVTVLPPKSSIIHRPSVGCTVQGSSDPSQKPVLCWFERSNEVATPGRALYILGENVGSGLRLMAQISLPMLTTLTCKLQLLHLRNTGEGASQVRELVWRLKKSHQLTVFSTVAYIKCLINVSKIKTAKILRNLATSFSRDQTYKKVEIQANAFRRLKFH